MTKTEKAYLAGIFDGEGSVGLYHHSTKTVAGKSPYWSRFISFPNSYRPAVRLFYRAFGGSFGRGGTSTNKPMWVWQTRNKHTIAYILRILIPFLKEKQRRAKIVLAVVEGRITDSVGCRRLHKLSHGRGGC